MAVKTGVPDTTGSEDRWLPWRLGRWRFRILDLDARATTRAVLDDMAAGTDVYYDRRWPVTERLARWLYRNPDRVRGRDVLVAGAGVGLESLVIARLCRRLYINDLSPTALALCQRQLRRNGLDAAACLPGRYETLALPPVDLVIGSYLVYDRDTAAAMGRLLETRPDLAVLLVNERLRPFERLLRQCGRAHEPLFDGEDGAVGLYFGGNHGA